MALVNPCSTGTSKNTGSECKNAMEATGMIVAMPVTEVWTAADELDFTTFMQTKLCAAPGQRWYPFGGKYQKISGITDANEADVLETQEDGSTDYVRPGMMNRTFMTTKGGECLAQALAALNKGYGFIEIDQKGKVKRMENADGTFSPFPTNLIYGPTPELANFKTVFKNKLYLSFSKVDYIENGGMKASDDSESILSLRGLYDVKILSAAAAVSSGGTAATGGYTIVKGATNDTIDVKVNGVSISGGPVIQTSSESTDTLLAAKVNAAITAHSSTNGGYTGGNTAGALTITAPVGLGATINAVQATATVVGTISTTTPVPFAGGVTGTTILKLFVKTDCAETDLIALYGSTLAVIANFLVTKLGVTITPSLISIDVTTGAIFLTIPRVNGTYIVNLAASATLLAAGIVGYEGTKPLTVVIS